tara:strand:- start:874 stop:1326 length:453 start_codon:yes stop_codon:yes gene_type:complete
MARRGSKGRRVVKRPIRRKFDDEIAQHVWDYYHKFGPPWSERSLSDNAIEEIDIHYPSASIMITPFYRTTTKPAKLMGNLIGRRGKVVKELKNQINQWYWRNDQLEWEIQILLQWDQADIWKMFKDESTSDAWRDGYPYLLCDTHKGEEE